MLCHPRTPTVLARPIAGGLLVAGLLLGGATGAALAAETGAADGEPDGAACEISPAAAPLEGCAGERTLIAPDPTVGDTHPIPWEQVVVGSDGRTLAVDFSMGVRECHGLHSVQVSPTRGGIDLTLLAGTPQGAEDLMCVAIVEPYRTVVVLDEPLIGDGSGAG